MSTIKDVASIAGVSIATVSRVVNNGPKVGNKTRDKVLKVMAEIGYTPNANARALVKKKNTTLGVVIPALNDPFFASLANGVERIARDKKQHMLLSTGGFSCESELNAINLLIEQRCESMVVHSKKLADETLIELSKKVPGIIFIDRIIPGIEERCIWLENIEGGKIAARHLLALGHANFALLNSNFDIEDPNLRRKGFVETIENANSVQAIIQEINHEPTLKGGEMAAQQLLSLNKPFSAVFAYNDAMAIGAISVLEDNGIRIPEDVSVIGFDDVLLSQYSRPKLTTMHYPIENMAENAAKLAIEFGNNSASKNDFKHRYIPSLVKRESTSSCHD
ncbi:LacI family DNA-binding transcriptional regulator [Thalassotalea sp. SU-HH00458]|uniref:LacI family DNA-binding transcriptional regulator n=1 Tax=Thalassotalea sp. SU-HH00458 TaxID=3127657 RepID=UPI003109FF8B